MAALDTNLFYALNSLAGQSPFLDSVIVCLASYLAYALGALFVLFLFLSHYPDRKKLEIVLVTGLSAVIARFGAAELIRLFYHRPRPFTDLPVTQLLSNTEWSFPSGHATFFFAVATAVYLYHKKWGIGFFVAAILMAISRVASGIHYPSDIVGGALIGVLFAYGIVRFAKSRTAAEGHQTSVLSQRVVDTFDE